VVDAVRPRHKMGYAAVVPVVYRVNLRDPAAYFFAKAMMLQDKDVLYVSNARTIEIAKLLSLFNLGTRTVGNVLPYARLSGD
jgi:polysaccharide export outer membrane protein